MTTITLFAGNASTRRRLCGAKMLPGETITLTLQAEHAEQADPAHPQPVVSTLTHPHGGDRRKLGARSRPVTVVSLGGKYREVPEAPLKAGDTFPSLKALARHAGLSYVSAAQKLAGELRRLQAIAGDGGAVQAVVELRGVRFGWSDCLPVSETAKCVN